MQPKAKMLAYALLAQLERDQSTKDQVKVYGDWAGHLHDQLEDEEIED